MRSQYGVGGEKPGLLTRGLQEFAMRRDPSLRSPQPKMPLWARHFGMWLGKQAIKGLFKLIALPFTGLRSRRLAPFAVTTWLAGASAALSAVPNGWHTAIALSLLGAPIVWRQAGLPMGRATRTSDTSLGMKLRRLATYLTGAALAVTTSISPHVLVASPGLFLAWAPLAAWAAGYWGNKPTAPEVEVTEPPEIDERLTIWNQRIAPDLDGAQLRGLEPVAGVESAWQAIIDLSETKKTFDDLPSRVPQIAARYKLAPTSVSIIPVPGRHDLGTLMVFEKNPLQRVQKFQGPTLDMKTGKFVLGNRIDGLPTHWQLFVPGWGACHGFVYGITGGGKSAAVNTVLIEARHSGVVLTLLGDPHGGKSYPDWVDNVTMFAGSVARIYAMLVGVEREMADRAARATAGRFRDEKGRERRRGAGYMPTRDEPMMKVIIDEWAKVASDPVYGDECVRIAVKITEDGRKFGAGITLINQMPDVDKNGGDRSLRSNASGMNLLVFRTGDRISSNIGIPVEFPVNPADLPKAWPDGSTAAGIGYNVQESDGTVQMRSLYTPGQDDGDELIEWATSGDPAPLPERTRRNFGPFGYCWQELVDIPDGTVIAIGPNGEHLRVDDPGGLSIEPANIAMVSAGREQRAVTTWERIAPLLLEHPEGATTKMLCQATGLKPNLVSTTLARYAEKGYVEVVGDEKANVWRPGSLLLVDAA